MPKGPIRRSQLIAPFGVGAMVVVRDGTSLIVAGLDHWYKRESPEGADVAVEEFEFEEWRLQKELGVECFRLPPDYRKSRRGQLTKNAYLTVPFLRFPQWHVCPSCKLLLEMPLELKQAPKCPECQDKGHTRYMFQVPFVAMCDHGHIQDFPWREWVHRTIHPTCTKPMRLHAKGGASLSAQIVICECGERRSLAGITGADPEKNVTYLTEHLDRDGTPFLCPGRMPWLGSEKAHGCSRPIRGSLRNAANVYFPQVRSAIYLPREAAGAPQELVEALQKPPLSTLVHLIRSSGEEPRAENIREMYPRLVASYTDEELNQALRVTGEEPTAGVEVSSEPKGETEFRRAEYEVLRVSRESDALRTRVMDIGEYEPWMGRYFEQIVLVEKLRETRAFIGFSRVFPTAPFRLKELRQMLWRRPPKKMWLPAYQVFGEGILLIFKEERLRSWEQDPTVLNRVNVLNQAYQTVRSRRRLEERQLSPRFVLLHTVAHLLMNRLTFECGYSSAALRERLYISTGTSPMAGVLIYTAAGDSEGTMGGLVRMGHPGLLEPVLQAALEAARWCSADPVCMEVGSTAGQGPDSCNLAACHNCALVPETACEEFNRFLDRGVVVGDVDGVVTPYFDRFHWQGAAQG